MSIHLTRNMFASHLLLLGFVCSFGELSGYGSNGRWSPYKSYDHPEGEEWVRPPNPFLHPSHEVQPNQDYSYTSRGGAKNWPKFFPECGGNQQSPVNILPLDLRRQPFPPLTFSQYWDNSNTALLNNTGKHIKVKLQGSDKLPFIRGGPLDDRYTFVELHFHWGPDDFEGSEHQLDGSYFSMEAHLVHFKSSYQTMEEAAKHKDGIAVVAFFLEAHKKSHNKKLEDIVSKLIEVRKALSTTQLASPSAGLHWLRDRSHDDFVTYQGSLTTPPCSEVVTWIIIPRPIFVSSHQVEQFRFVKATDGSKIKSNLRPIQRQFVDDIVSSL